jgi:tight adherence protein C
MDPIILIVILVVVVVGLAIALVVVGLSNPQNSEDRMLQTRLDEMSRRGQEVNLEKLELQQPISQRIILPMARKLGELAIRFTPQNAMQSIARQLEMAGNPGRLDPTMLLASQFIVAAFFCGLIVIVFSVSESRPPLSQTLLYGVGFGVLGYFFPQLWLRSKVQRRQKAIRRAMPDALDLLTICVEAGLGFDAAMAKVTEKWDNPLSIAFARIIQEVQLGRLRREAMRDMADRVGIAEMTSFVAAIIQSELLGVSMAKVLRIQSDQMRVRRRQHAEEEAHKAPLKMLAPMGLLIFPALMIVLISPAIMRLLTSGLGKMFGVGF